MNIDLEETRIILLIGKTGSGKSTLANVLSDSVNYFGESSGSTSATQEIKEKNFEVDGIKYRVIDTVGFRDTGLGNSMQKRNNFLGSFKSNVNSFFCEGIHQILYVIDKRVTADEVTDFKLLSSHLFDKRVFDYTTIVKTHFSDFDNKKKCEEDANKLKETVEDDDIKKVISEGRIVYVNNIDKKLRKTSREILLNHLSEVNNRNGEQLDCYKIMASAGIMERFNFLKNKIGSVASTLGGKFRGLLFNTEEKSQEEAHSKDLEELIGLVTAIGEGNWINKDLAKKELELYQLTMKYTNSLNKSIIDKYLVTHEKIVKIKLTEKNWHSLTEEYENELSNIEEKLERKLSEDEIEDLRKLNQRVTVLKVFSGELAASEKFQLQLNILNYIADIGLKGLLDGNSLDLLKDDKFTNEILEEKETKQETNKVKDEKLIDEKLIDKKKNKLESLKRSLKYDGNSQTLLEVLLIAQEKAITNTDDSANQQKKELIKHLMKKSGFSKLIKILKMNEEIIELKNTAST